MVCILGSWRGGGGGGGGMISTVLLSEGAIIELKNN